MDDLLDVSRADGGNLTLERRPFDFQLLVSEFKGMAHSIFSKKRQTVTIFNFEEPIWIDGDRSRINQVLNNLMPNASKYSPEDSEITLRTSLKPGHVEFEIEDHGIGIDSHDLNSIFVPFYRAADANTQLQSGTGLGLSVVKTLIELHGGVVRINSEVGKGTTVLCSLVGVVAAPGV